MKQETILDVLMYLFDHYLEDIDGESLDDDADQDAMKKALYQAGFGDEQVLRAFEWLDDLSARQQPEAPRATGKRALRVYHPEEIAKLDAESRGFLLFLEQTGVLGATGRELIIDRCMALDDEEVGLDQLKWVALVVLFNQPGQGADFTWMENVIYEELTDNLH